MSGAFRALIVCLRMYNFSEKYGRWYADSLDDDRSDSHPSVQRRVILQFIFLKLHSEKDLTFQ